MELKKEKSRTAHIQLGNPVTEQAQLKIAGDQATTKEANGKQVIRGAKSHTTGDGAVSVLGLPRGGEPSNAQLQLLRHHSRALESAHPREIIAWAVKQYFPKLTMATAFGPEGCVILHLLAEVEPRVHVFNLDTGYQFKETLELRDRIATRYGIQVKFERPELSVQEYEEKNGGPVYAVDADRCCLERKVRVLRRAVAGFHGWMSGIRRDQSPHRQNTPIIDWDQKFQLVKISPLAGWTKHQIWDLIRSEDIPYNLLHEKGYLSIGCWPCTRAVAAGEDERAGRWSGAAKTECGLHVQG
ncbi:MAG: phosphoadenylyl-sulfate reductase [Pirellulales bacterium]|nr:phosphoadenylyl-sulfate reductase [Pirellulales bacterium]